jgi:hypothetical protein
MDRVCHLFEILKNQYTLMKGIPNKIVKLKNYSLFKTLDICKKYMYPKSNNMFWYPSKKNKGKYDIIKL